MNERVPLLARLLRLYHRAGLRGRTRLTMLLARRVESLRSVPVEFSDRATVFVDLRGANTHDFFRDARHTLAGWESDEQAAMRRLVREGDVVFDIGANIGVHTSLLARLVGGRGRVLAFEPNPQLTAGLRRTIAGLPNTSLHTVALSDERSECTLFVTEGDSTLSSLAEWTPGVLPHKVNPVAVAQQPMDDFIKEHDLPSPDFLKCDVEGAELKVFRGARATLDRPDAPVILFEVNLYTARGFGVTMTAAKDYLASLPEPRYRFFDIGGGGLTPLGELTGVHTNIVAVPEHRASLV